MKKIFSLLLAITLAFSLANIGFFIGGLRTEQWGRNRGADRD